MVSYFSQLEFSNYIRYALLFYIAEKRRKNYMRKRLIGKAFAIAMSGAMVLTATPVTANIFHVAHIVKAANDAQLDEWTYCYVGLTWAEYWANEGVYNANDTSSSDVEDCH